MKTLYLIVAGLVIGYLLFGLYALGANGAFFTLKLRFLP